MVVIFIRTTIIFITLLIIMRLMGKRQIGEMQPFELVITLLIAELACIPMADVSIPLVYGIVAIIALFVLHQIMSLIDQKSVTFKRLASGKPSIVINLNGVDLVELKRNNLDVSDLIESMRSSGYFSLDDVSYGIFEANGKFSALASPKSDEKPSLPLLLVNEGKPVKRNVQLLEFGDEEFGKFFQSANIKHMKDVDIMTVDGNGKVYLQTKGEKYRILNIELPEGKQW